jgi:phage shock protein C
MINSTSSDTHSTGTRSTPHLHRSATDAVLAGVCGGIAEYLSLDPSLVRLAFVVATLWGGIGVLAYIVLAIVLPVDQRTGASVSTSVEGSRIVAGLSLVFLGAVLMAGNMGWAPWLSWNLVWPGILILIGLGLLVRDQHGTSGA